MKCCLCHRPAVHTTVGDSLCGPCAVASQIEILGENEGRTYEAQPLMIHGVVVSWEVYEVSSDARRFFCTGQEWPASAACRRIGAVARCTPR